MLRLDDKVIIVTGIANNESIAWGVASAIYAAGGKVVGTYQNEKTYERFTKQLFIQVGTELCMPLDVTVEGQLEAVFEATLERYGRIDGVLHSMAYANQTDLHGPVVNCSLKGFQEAIDISCHSFVRMAKLAEIYMANGGSLVTLTYLGADKAAAGYGMMGPVKAALQAFVPYLAVDLGGHGVRVNAVSAGPIYTRAGKGLANFNHLVDMSNANAPLRGGLTIEDVGAATAFYFTDAAKAITGQVVYVDNGVSALAPVPYERLPALISPVGAG